MRQPRIFAHFPQHQDHQPLCPVCNTAEDAPCVLVPIEGTEEHGRAQALPVHVNCAIAERIVQHPDGILMLLTVIAPNFPGEPTITAEIQRSPSQPDSNN